MAACRPRDPRSHFPRPIATPSPRKTPLSNLPSIIVYVKELRCVCLHFRDHLVSGRGGLIKRS
jgi:hypothetical protein